MPELIMGSPDQFFEYVKKSKKKLPVVNGEILHHSSGCYSAHSEVKKLNRKAENRLVEAEIFSVISGVILKRRTVQEKLTEAWKTVLFNQFHDIMAGTSIEPAYEDARNGYGAALHTSALVLNDAIQALSWKINIPMEEGMKPVVVFNPNGFACKSEVELESPVLPEGTVLLDEHDQELPYQTVQSAASCNGRTKLVFIADIPSFGWRTYRFAKRNSQKVFPEVSSDDVSAENKWFKIVFDKNTGYIASFIKKNDQTEYFGAPAAVPVVIEDKSDTWSHGVRIFDKKIGAFYAVSVKRIASGPVKATIRVTSKYGDSRIVQDFSVYQDMDYVTVKTTLDWHEKWKMLKIQFPMNLNYLRCSYEIPYGTVTREPDGEEYPMQNFVDAEGAAPGMTTNINGLSVINDGKFGVSAEGRSKTMSITVLRSPIYCNHEPYEADEKLEYVYMDQGVQTFTYGLYPHDGKWENADTVKRSRQMNHRPIALFETYHKGELSQSGSFLQISEENVMISVMKWAEDGSGDMILRFSETIGMQKEVTIRILPLDREIKLTFSPFELKTVRLAMDGSGQVRETNLLEE